MSVVTFAGGKWFSFSPRASEKLAPNDAREVDEVDTWDAGETTECRAQFVSNERTGGKDVVSSVVLLCTSLLELPSLIKQLSWVRRPRISTGALQIS